MLRRLRFYYYYYYSPTSTKPQAWKLTLGKWEMIATTLSFGDYSVVEGDRISELWIGVGKGMLFSWCPLWWFCYACQFRAMYQLSPRQMGRSCEYWPVWHTCQSCSVLSLGLLHLALLPCCLCGTPHYYYLLLFNIIFTLHSYCVFLR